MQGSNLGLVQHSSRRRVELSRKITTGGADDLIDDGSFNTVDDECPPQCHLRKVSQENFLGNFFPGFLVYESCIDFKR